IGESGRSACVARAEVADDLIDPSNDGVAPPAVQSHPPAWSLNAIESNDAGLVNEHPVAYRRATAFRRGRDLVDLGHAILGAAHVRVAARDTHHPAIHDGQPSE